MSGTLVTVAAFDNVLEAGYWRGMLEAEGIPVAVADQEIVATEWQISGAVGHIKLQVPEAEASRASALLEDVRKQHPYRQPEESEARRALRVAVLGLLCPPIQIASLWMICRLVPRRRTLDRNDRRRLVLAALLSLWLPLWAFVWIRLLVVP
jgi:hypothetical protein